MTAIVRFACSSAAIIALLVPSAFAAGNTEQLLQGIVGNFADASISSGRAVGLAVGVVYPGQPLRTYTFGYANANQLKAVTTVTPFNIGSVTKVFTTNLLGQGVAQGTLKLTTRLGELSAQIGKLKPKTREITLLDLADFTAGMPDVPLCQQRGWPGCAPSGRPTIKEYGVEDFLKFFKKALPRDYYTEDGQPTPVDPHVLAKLPGPYVYSDFSTGLLGLLVTAGDGYLPQNAVDIWFDRVNRLILQPLDMTHTGLGATAQGELAKGYSLATAEATVMDDKKTGKKGTIESIDVTVPGLTYNAAPAVRIEGGGGHGASATAHIKDHRVTGIDVSDGGSGYVTPPKITFTKGGAKQAVARAVISGGHIVAIQVDEPGAGYPQATAVTITGGGGSGAQAVAHIANGQVVAVTMKRGGMNYRAPLAVIVEPSSQVTDTVPVWAAAGALTSTITDMTNFTAAALGLDTVRSMAVPAVLTKGFAFAQTPYACAAKISKLGNACKASKADQVGMAWSVQPADNGLPVVVSKNGGVPGFSTELVLIPESGIGVVVMANVYTNEEETKAGDDDATTLKSTILEAPADTVAKQIAYNIYYGLRTSQ
jgi:CubicO group peptidase (beta-lactamase class C family)